MHRKNEQQDLGNDIETGDGLPASALSDLVSEVSSAALVFTYLFRPLAVGMECPVVADVRRAANSGDQDRNTADGDHSQVADVVQSDLRGCLCDPGQENQHCALRQIERDQE